MQSLTFLTTDQIDHIKNNYSTPIFVYSQSELEKYAHTFINFPNAFWVTPRYAMKANSNMNILKVLDKVGLHIDASSGYEVIRAINSWIDWNRIQLTTQQYPENLKELLSYGIFFNATSLTQLENYWKINPGWEVSVRINPWLGSWSTNRTNVWWPASSFGIWHEYIDQVLSISKKYDLKITKVHTHIWSWTDPMVWTKVAKMSLDLLFHFPDAHTLNLGGWFKVARMPYEVTADINFIWNQVKEIFENFYNETWRKIHLEVEPGTYLVANSASLITTIHDIVDTWKDGYKFLKVNAWMTEVTRPSLYGAQHPLVVVNNSSLTEEYLVVGHCCESGDIFTPAKWDPEWLLARQLKKAEIWDILVVEWVGAYCSSMSTKNYNSYPEIGEVLIKTNWQIVEIRKPQHLEEIWKNEIIAI